MQGLGAKSIIGLLQVPGLTEGRGSVYKAHPARHPLKPGGTKGVRGHTWN